MADQPSLEGAQPEHRPASIMRAKESRKGQTMEMDSSRRIFMNRLEGCNHARKVWISNQHPSLHCSHGLWNGSTVHANISGMDGHQSHLRLSSAGAPARGRSSRGLDQRREQQNGQASANRAPTSGLGQNLTSLYRGEVSACNERIPLLWVIWNTTVVLLQFFSCSCAFDYADLAGHDVSPAVVGAEGGLHLKAPLRRRLPRGATA